MTKRSDDFWHLDFRPDQIETLQTVLTYMANELQTGSKGYAIESLARRISLARVYEIQNMLTDVTG